MSESKKIKLLLNIPIVKINLKDIKVNNRIRKETGNLAELRKSLQTYGQLNPLLVDDRYYLIAGERRYLALKSMGETQVEVKIIKNVNEYDRLVLEMEENTTRKEFNQQEYFEALERKKLLEIKKESYLKYLWKKIITFFSKNFNSNKKK